MSARDRFKEAWNSDYSRRVMMAVEDGHALDKDAEYLAWLRKLAEADYCRACHEEPEMGAVRLCPRHQAPIAAKEKGV